MVRYNFGGDSADFVYTVTAGGLIKVNAAVVTFWTAETGGTRYTDLLLGGVPVTSVNVAASGDLPTFQGPDAVVSMWADAGGARSRVTSDAPMVDQATQATVTTGRLSAAALSATIASEAVTHFSVKSFGAVGDGTTNDTAAIAAAIAAAKAAQSFTVLRTTVYFPRGTYLTDSFQVPAGVTLLGEGSASSAIKNRSTNGGVFIHFMGSYSECRGLRIDGQRAAQSSLGLASVQFSRPNALAAGAINISGGVTIADVPAGATSITVNDDSPAAVQIVAGEYISLVEGATFELVQVAASYTGGTTIPLVNPLANPFTVAAMVSVAVTGVGVYDCEVLGNGRDGIAFWHTVFGKALNNRVSDYEDTGIDLPSAGSWWVEIGSNVFETKGRWGIAFDTAETYFGPVTECTSHDNVVRFQSGGSFVNGNTIDGIYFGNVVRCKSVNDTVDLTLAGLAGATYAGSSYGARDCEVVNLTVKGPASPRANTFGVRVTVNNSDIRPKIVGGNISKVKKGVDFSTTRTGIIIGTHFTDTDDFAVTITSDASNIQKFSATGIYANGNVGGFRVGGTAAVGAQASVTGCILLGSSFAPVLTDTNWTITQTAVIT